MFDSLHAGNVRRRLVLRRLLPASAVLVLCAATGHPQQAQLGSWSPGISGDPHYVYDWNDQIDPDCSVHEDYAEISHAALIPIGTCAGKVILWRRSRDSSCVPTETTEVWLFSPDNPWTALLVA